MQKGSGKNSFIISTTSPKEKNTYFEDENHQTKKTWKKCTFLSSIIKTIDTVVIQGTTFTSVPLSVGEFCIVTSQRSTTVACDLALIVRSI